ncbi:hypothetical protein [Vibrio rotiferianus]|uniref:hypothetical protein n=1 Tax=Vibrio rotiferianus TaxID=190895 RepID=UPI0005F078B5|nr:hypothetical protein [Vibrio rotiferianus]
MKHPHKISAVMYKLLIERKMDGFSVTEARDASLSSEDSVQSFEQARKKVYRQIWQFQQKGWLRSEGKGRNKRYFQTKHFKSLQFNPKKSYISEERTSSFGHYSILVKELGIYKRKLEVSLGEIDECNLIKEKFPELEAQVFPLLDEARNRAALLLGKINVLTNVLRVLPQHLKMGKTAAK